MNTALVASSRAALPKASGRLAVEAKFTAATALAPQNTP